MHNHFYKGINLNKHILLHKPKYIVECGAGSGELTRLIQGIDDYPFRFTVISDSDIRGLDSWVSFINGISYIELEKMADNSIDLCIIDTDHNYWTLAKELNILDKKVSDGGFIALHDVVHFYHHTGVARSYGNGVAYPEEEIISVGLREGGVGNALIDYLSKKKFGAKLIDFSNEFNGAAIIEKKDLSEVEIHKALESAPYAGANQYEKAI